MRNKLINTSILMLFATICQAEKILVLTDIHFNPYSQCIVKNKGETCILLKNLLENPVENWTGIFPQESINGYKQETNNAFLIQGLDNLAKITKKEKIKTILITGDLLEHDFGAYYEKLAPYEYNEPKYLSSFTYKTMVYVLERLHSKIPDSKIYLALGNNDSDNGDYNLPSSDWLESMAIYLSDYTKNNKKEFIASFSQGGYFSAPLMEDVTLIGINSNILSAINPNTPLARQQLSWLKQKLTEAVKLKRQVVLFQHIPYGADLYRSSVSNKFVPLMDLDLQAAYIATLNQYASIIKTIYTGHYHAELLSIVNAKIPVIGSIAFNTLFGNNPGFKIINIDEKGNLAGYTTYYSELQQGHIIWNQLYDFEQTYGQPKQLTTILNQFPFAATETKVVNYRKYFNGNNPKYPQPINSDQNWKFYYCGIKYVAPNEYLACIESITNTKATQNNNL